MKSIITIKPLRSATTEIVSIVIGVLLALAVNEWNEDRIHTERANEAIDNIIQEIDANVKFITAVNNNNQSVVDLIKSEKTIQIDEGQRQFIPGLQIQDTAWKTLLSTGISEYIEYSTLYEMSSIYSLQDIYKKLGYQLVQTMMSNQVLMASIYPDNEKSTKNDLFLNNMALIVEVEKALLNSYKKTLQELKNSASK